jgi:phosphatidylglycerol:prolipoprotein diacylglycerol transferase
MPTGFQIGPLIIRYYGIILMLGALAGAWLTAYEARRKGADSEIVWDGLVWALIGGIVGARLWHIFTPPASMVEQGITTLWYLTHPLDILAIWRGGLGIPGAVIGGALAVYFYCRKHKLSFLFWADAAAPGLALGQAIGRWGNFINQELYGKPTSLPWAIKIDPQYRLPGYENQAYYHPVFLYESLWNLGVMGLMLWVSRRYPERLKDGDIFLVYLIGYPTGRFLIEFLRLDPSLVAGVNTNQALMLIIALLTAGLLAWRHRSQGAPALQAKDESAAEGGSDTGSEEMVEDDERESTESEEHLEAEEGSEGEETDDA